MYKLKFLILVVLSCLAAFAAHPVLAAQPGITVSPAIAQIDLAADPAEVKYTFENTTDYFVQLDLSAKDFNGLETGWQVHFLGPDEAANYTYSLSSWLGFATRTFVLDPGAKKEVKITIDASRLSKGGHYATVIAKFSPAQGTLVSGGGVPVSGSLAALLFVRAKTGQEIESASLSDFRHLQRHLEIPDSFSFRFHNLGNVDLTPHGRISVTNFLNHEVAFGIVNENSDITLPETIRRYEVKWRSLDPFLLPGKYDVSLQVHYGKSATLGSAKTSFYTLGSREVWVAGLLVLIVACLVIARLHLNKFRPNSTDG